VKWWTLASLDHLRSEKKNYLGFFTNCGRDDVK